MKALSRKQPITSKGSPSEVGTAPVAHVITPAGRYDLASPDKLRGGYYTPSDLADWIADWAISDNRNKVCEPSCGDGNMLIAAAKRLLAHGASPKEIQRQLKGVELSPPEAAKARQRLDTLLDMSTGALVEATDFFEWYDRTRSRQSSEKFDAVIGNPPFIRYQSFPEPARSRAMRLMCASGLKPNKLTNMWVPFIVAAAELLRSGGKLGLVVPAELLQVSYAAQLRRYLTSKFDRVDVVSCNELFFQDAEQEVLLLLASGARPSVEDSSPACVRFLSTESVEEITLSTPPVLLQSAEEKKVCNDSEKWLKYFLTSTEIEFMRELRRSAICSPVSEFADVDVGVVTGKNEFFVVNRETSIVRGLADIHRPAVGRSAHLAGAIFSKDDWATLDQNNQRVRLIDYSEKSNNQLTAGELSYIEYGESRDFHSGFKCRIRKPWFEVPGVWIPDGFLFRQIYDFPRMVSNNAHAVPTDTIHRLRVHGCGLNAFLQSSYTYLSGASSEIEGRSYGGGVLELEPTEAEKVLVPSNSQSSLPLNEIDRLVRRGKIEEVLAENSRQILGGDLGLSKRDVALLRDIWLKMRNRRSARRRRR